MTVRTVLSKFRRRPEACLGKVDEVCTAQASKETFRNVHEDRLQRQQHTTRSGGGGGGRGLHCIFGSAWSRYRVFSVSVRIGLAIMAGMMIHRAHQTFMTQTKIVLYLSVLIRDHSKLVELVITSIDKKGDIC